MTLRTHYTSAEEEFMVENYPGYSELVSFQDLRHYYFKSDTPVKLHMTDYEFEEVSLHSTCVTSESESQGDFSSGSARSFLMFGDDEHELELYESESLSSLDLSLPSEGTIPISLWFDDSMSLSDHLEQESESEDDHEIGTPVDEEPESLKELRDSLNKLIITPASSDPEYDPLQILVTESLAPLDDDLRLSPIDCFADVCWASHQNFLDVPKLTSWQWRSMDVPEEAYLPEDSEEIYTMPFPAEDISHSPPSPRRPKSTNSFRRFAQRIRNNSSFGRKRA